MLVVIANHIPDAVRGRMKLWFIEPKPNVFISGVKDVVAKKVVDFLFKNCPRSSGLMVFTKINKSPGFFIQTLGETSKSLTQISGFQLIKEK